MKCDLYCVPPGRILARRVADCDGHHRDHPGTGDAYHDHGVSDATETVVIREVQTIHQAQMQYFSQFGDYAVSLAQLGPLEHGTAGGGGAKLIPRSLASGEKNGYVFTLVKTATGFAVNANPKAFGKNGRRTFFVDEDGAVQENWNEKPATVDSPEVK